MNSDAAKIALQLSKGFDLSEVAKLNYQAIANGSLLSEAETVNTEPLRYRNQAFYVGFAEGWKSPRYPSDEVCAAQIKLVKGAAKSYLYFIENEGLQWLVDHPEHFG